MGKDADDLKKIIESNKDADISLNESYENRKQNITHRLKLYLEESGFRERLDDLREYLYLNQEPHLKSDYVVYDGFDYSPHTIDIFNPKEPFTVYYTYQVRKKSGFFSTGKVQFEATVHINDSELKEIYQLKVYRNGYAEETEALIRFEDKFFDKLKRAIAKHLVK